MNERLDHELIDHLRLNLENIFEIREGLNQCAQGKLVRHQLQLYQLLKGGVVVSYQVLRQVTYVETGVLLHSLNKVILVSCENVSLVHD